MKTMIALVAVAGMAVFAQQSPAQESGRTHTSYNSTSRKYDYTLVTTDGKVSSWGNMGGNTDNLRDRTKVDTLYVRKDGDLYAITDRDTVTQAIRAVEPMEKLGKQMGEAGKRQGEWAKKYGTQQSEIGKQMGEVGRRMGEAAREGKPIDDLRAKMHELSEKMKALSVDRPGMTEMGAKMRELGKQMGQAGKEADQKITKLIDDAFARGLAHKE